MIRCYVFAFCMISFAAKGVSQNFLIGELDTVLFDAERQREIPVSIFFPVEETQQTALADGVFPVITIGHGFTIEIAAYQNFVDRLVPDGHVIVLVDTETGAFPDHFSFGQDLAFSADVIRAWSQIEDSRWEGHFYQEVVLMGHSMGAGASVLAASEMNDVSLLILMAPAETDPSAILAAEAVAFPTLIISGQEDLVTPWPVHGLPIYEALKSECKCIVDIIGGGHCYFTLENFFCDLGESISGSDISISRTEQQEITFDYIASFLETIYTEPNQILDNFLVQSDGDERVDASHDCLVSQNSIASQMDIELYPNPTTQKVYCNKKLRSICVYSLYGQVLLEASDVSEIDVSMLDKGTYIVVCKEEKGSFQKTIIKQ